MSDKRCEECNGCRRNRRRDSLAEYCDDEARAEEPTRTVRLPRRERDAVPSKRLPRKHADLGEHFMGVGEQSKAAEQRENST